MRDASVNLDPLAKSYMMPPRKDQVPSDTGETATLKSLQQDARQIAKFFEPFVKLKTAEVDALDQLEKALKGFPVGPQLSTAIDEFRSRATTILASTRAARSTEMGRHEAAFVSEQKALGNTVREAGDGKWRIGILELEIQRERSRAQFLYNHEALSGWGAISGLADLSALYTKANGKLEASALPKDSLPTLVWESYEQCRSASSSGSRASGTGARVKLVDLYIEFRVSMTRQELSGRPDRKLSRADFPKWAYLYNLDLYRRQLPNIDEKHRLTFETGSQQDHSKGLAVVLNGLEMNAAYKSFCFVYAAPPAQPTAPGLLL